MTARISPPFCLSALLATAGLAAALTTGAAAYQTDPPESQPKAPPASQPDRPAKPSRSAEDPSTEQQEQQQTPEARELIERAIDYMGGREAFEAIESWHTRMQMDSPMGGVITVDLYQHGEDQILIDMRIPPIGSAVTARNGAVGWSTAMGEYQLLTEQQMAGIEDEHYHTLLLDLQEEYSEIVTEGRERFAGEEAWKVRVQGRKQGAGGQRSRAQFFFFDTRTGRLLGIQEGQSRGATVKRFEDWRFFGDLELFTKVIEEQGREMTREYVDIKLNELDEEIFAIPHQVERLLEEKKRDTEVGPPLPPSTGSSGGR